MRPRLTPQRKKALSYSKDRRNTYGENAKASRRLIPRRKAWVNRVFRRQLNAVLRPSSASVSLEELELLDGVAKSLRRPDWRKVPDTPLGEVIERKRPRRRERAGWGKTLRKRADEFTAGLDIKTESTDKGWIARVSGPFEIAVAGATPEGAIAGCKVRARLLFMESLGGIEDLRIDSEGISYRSR